MKLPRWLLYACARLFFHTSVVVANNLNPDQARHSVGPKLLDTQMVFR